MKYMKVTHNKFNISLDPKLQINCRYGIAIYVTKVGHKRVKIMQIQTIQSSTTSADVEKESKAITKINITLILNI